MNTGTGQPAAARVAGRALPDVTGDGLITDLCRSANILRTHLERTVLRPEGFDMRWTAFDVLQLVCGRRSAETGVIASHIGVAKGTVTGISTELRARGLLERRLKPGDHRRVLLRPTQAGAELTRRIRARLAAEEYRLLHQTRAHLGPHAVLILRQLAATRRTEQRRQPDGSTTDLGRTRDVGLPDRP